MTKKIKIAVDGFSSCGKSTLAMQLAAHFGFIYVDSGAMYRAVTLYALRNGVFEQTNPDIPKLIKELIYIEIDFKSDLNGNNFTFLNGENVEEEIRQLEVSSKVSIVSAVPEVRRRLVELQKAMSENKSVVMDGRDIGTVVFPDAELKMFLTATPEVRAKRRYDELRGKNQNVNLETIIQNINERDFLDQNRKDSPLKMAEDAILIDNSALSRKQQLEYAIELVKNIYNAD